MCELLVFIYLEIHKYILELANFLACKRECKIKNKK